ncbi:MAG: cytidylate kinase-like family protein [Lachnospiraceae bacterium]|nr:cytidylate kinase-like family protein [Lachnospiraceae bacterium]
MQKTIITIGREYGSGGYEMAKRLSEALGWKYYDRELIAEIAEKSMISESFVESKDEVGGKRNIFQEVFPIFANHSDDQEKYIFNRQGEFIRELAEKQNCIIIGRRADYYLKDNPAACHLFLYADMDFRIERICKKLNCDEKTAREKIQDMDKKRKTSYEYTTGRSWGDMHNYDRLICTSAFGLDAAVEEVVTLIKNQK